jgi:CRP/FNR family transcriptional regulator, cyclic AMP receptor protein
MNAGRRPLVATNPTTTPRGLGRQNTSGHWHLSQVPLLTILGNEELAQLEQQARVRSFKRKEVIYVPSEAGESVLIVLQGRVKLKDITHDGKEAILGFVEAGELFGELALFDNEARQNYAEAVLPTELTMIPRKAFLAVMDRRPELSLSITKLIGLRRRQVESRLRQLLFRSTQERLIFLLLDFLPQHGKPTPQGIELTLPLSHQDLASLVGATRESVTMALGELQGEGMLRVKRQRLVIYDLAKLREKAPR